MNKSEKREFVNAVIGMAYKFDIHMEARDYTMCETCGRRFLTADMEQIDTHEDGFIYICKGCQDV